MVTETVVLAQVDVNAVCIRLNIIFLLLVSVKVYPVNLIILLDKAKYYSDQLGKLLCCSTCTPGLHKGTRCSASDTQ